MNVPTAYSYLLQQSILPRTIQEAIKYLGVHEVVGKGSNVMILKWRDALNAAGHKIEGFSDDDIPWCGLFAAYVAFMAGKEPVKNPLWARNWANFGVQVAHAALGDCLVFVREGGGHVGWYVGEDERCYHVLGGNQQNAVTITRIEKKRCIAIRRPKMTTPPASVKPFVIAANGSVSSNEA